MKTIRRVLSLLVILCMCIPLIPIPAAEAASPSTVSVMSYNLKNTNYKFGDVASMVTANGADIVAMQEVNTLQYLGINAAMENAGFDVTMGKSTGFGDNWESDEYLPIYYKADKYKDYAHGTLWLSDTPTVQSQFADSQYLRIVNWACYEIIGTNNYILVFNTHLDFALDLQIRQLDVILEAIVAQTTKYFKAKDHVIFLGDLNCANTSVSCKYIQGDTPYSVTNATNTYTMQKLDEARQIAEQTTPNSFGNYYTQPSEKPTMDLDHIYVSHKGFRCESYSVISNAAGSDHLPILAQLVFKTESSHTYSYRWLSAGKHRATCNQCGSSADGACTYEGDFCKLCNGSKEQQTFALVKSMDELSTGKYLMLIQSMGAYPGSFPYYGATVYPDGGFTAMESKGMAFPALPEEITLAPEQLPSLVWNFRGDSKGLVIGDACGNTLNHKGRDMYLNKEGATVWVPDYSTSAGHFAIRENNTHFLSLRVDLNTIGKTGGDGPMFGCVDNTSTGTYKIFLYKESTKTVECKHTKTFISGLKDATCTAQGYTGDTVCSECGELLTSGHAVPALGHDYIYTSCENGTHELSCSHCELYDMEDCLTADGVCPKCGYVSDVQPPLEELHEGRYVIAAEVDGVYYAMSNTFDKKIPGVEIPVTDGKVRDEDAQGYVINLRSTEGGWTIDDGNGNYLKYASSTNLGRSDSPYVWTVENGVNGSRRVVSQTSGRGLVYRTKDYNQFGAYALSNATVTSTQYYDLELLPVGDGVIVEPTEPDLPDTTVTELRDGKYVIAANVDGTYYAMSTTFASKIPGTPVPVTDGKVKAADAEGYVVNLTAVDGGWTIDNDNGNYLKYGSSTNLGKSTTAYIWTIGEGTKGTWRVASADTDTRGLVFRAKSYNQFGGYALSNVKDTGTEYFDVELLPVEGGNVPVEPFTCNINHSLNLASDISINYAVLNTQLEGYSDFYLEVTVPIYDGNTQTGTDTVVIEPVLDGIFYYFTMNGLNATQMNDNLEAVLYASRDSKTYASNVDVYSIGTYAYNQLAKDTTTATLKTLCAELIRYGAKAQIFKTYRTNALVDAKMTAAHMAMLTDLGDVAFGNNNTTLNDLANPAVTWAGKVLILDSKVTLRYVINPTDYSGQISDLSLSVTYVNLEGETVTEILSDAELYNASLNYYSFEFSALRAAELRTVLSATLYAEGKQVSPTLQYSMDTYGNNKTGDLLILCQALMAYSDSALSYFRQ